jgi:hypothetical protein
MNTKNHFLSFRSLFLFLALEVSALAIIRLPAVMQFDNFAFFDIGANLTVQSLLDQGYRPGIDFGYPYGLLGLLAGRAWFGLAMRAPWSYQLAMWVCNLAEASALAALIVALEAGFLGILVFGLSLPVLVNSSFITFSHAIEAVLLLYALAAHAGGHRSAALALVTAAVLAKPSLAYFYGLLLLIFIVFELHRSRRLDVRGLLTSLTPALVTGVLGCGILILSFGVRPLIRTVLPTAGAQVYSVHHFGLLRAGKSFWAPGGASVAYYFESTAGCYILATLGLLVTALLLAIVLFAGKEPVGFRRVNAECVFCCAALQVMFISMLWGNQFSWMYYSYVPIIGLVAAIRFGWSWCCVPLVVSFLVPGAKLGRAAINHLESRDSTVVAVAVDRGSTNEQLQQVGQSTLGYTHWFSDSRSSDTANLWASVAEQREWQHVLSNIRGFRTAVLVVDGCVSLLYPELFMPPVSLYLSSGEAVPSEIGRALGQLQRSEMIVIPEQSANHQGWSFDVAGEFPQISQLINSGFVRVFEGRYFHVYAARHLQPPTKKDDEARTGMDR